MGYVAAAQSKANLLIYAENIRSAFQLENIEMINVVSIVECLHIFLKDFHYEYCEDSEVGNRGEGFYDPGSSKMIIPESVYESACNQDGRARFTIAHELGHVFLNHRVTLARSKNNNYPIYMDTEWQANTFATCFLAPPRLVCKYCTADEVAAHFGLSWQAAEIALENAKKAKH